MARTVEFYVNRATESFSKGFASKTAKKDALDDLNRAFDIIREEIHGKAIDLAREAHPNVSTYENYSPEIKAWYDAISQYDLPFGLHQVRDRHLDAISEITDKVGLIQDLIKLRLAIKDFEVPVRAPKEEGVEQKIRRTILEEINARKEKFDVAKRIVELFGEFTKDENGRDIVLLPVHVHHVYCRNYFGTDWIRIDWYLRGEKTAFNTIMAAAEEVKREQGK